jgi:hypothetical protein
MVIPPRISKVPKACISGSASNYRGAGRNAIVKINLEREIHPLENLNVGEPIFRASRDSLRFSGDFECFSTV